MTRRRSPLQETRKPHADPSPGTEEYYDANQGKLGVFLFGFATGYRTAWNARGEPLPQTLFRSRHAAMILINPEDSPNQIMAYFGEIALPPITVKTRDTDTPEDFTAKLGLTDEDIAIIRDYYLLSEKGRQLWRTPMIEPRFRKLIKRTPPPPDTAEPTAMQR
jgi:hypothetical protein